MCSKIFTYGSNCQLFRLEVLEKNILPKGLLWLAFVEKLSTGKIGKRDKMKASTDQACQLHSRLLLYLVDTVYSLPESNS